MRDEIMRLADNNSRWVTQDKFYDPSQPPEVCTGNCTEAALASILGIRLDQVPSFQGLVSEDYWDAVYAFVNSRGFDLVMNHRATHYPGLYLADGPSPRGCGHFVVMHDGEMIHDPHPSRAGLLSIEKTWALIPHDPASLASKTDHTEDKLGMVPEDRSKWSLHDRVEFALRDAGFDYDEAFNIASVAAAPAPDHSAGVGGMADDETLEVAAIAVSNAMRPHPNPRAYWKWLLEDERAKRRDIARAVIAALAQQANDQDAAT